MLEFHLLFANVNTMLAKFLPAVVLAFTSPGEDVARAGYECGASGEVGDTYGFEGDGLDTYCLAKCEGNDNFNRVTSAVDPEEYGEERCATTARKYCHKYGKDLESSCFGERSD